MHPLRFLLIVLIGSLCLGTVVKRKDAIELTKTDPIAYEQKKKEEAEGKKGPLVPTLNLYPREKFLIEPPMEKEGKKGEAEEEEAAPEEEALDWEEWFEEEEAPEFSEGEGEETDKKVKAREGADDTSAVGTDFVY